MTGREQIHEAIARRATHGDPEDVSRTVSLANGERLFGHEYHGRFLIELLQNAADAWDAGAGERERSRIEIAIAEGPVVLVANEGESFPASVVIKSLGHIGRSTKTEGKAIGHKGIGFKSVLEMSATPEIYSGLGSAEPELAVRFDPREALEKIHQASPDWPTLAADHVSEADGNELALVPVLQFPMWVDTLPSDVQELAERGFETVIRIPFGDDLRPDSALDEERWLNTVRHAIEGVSDEMLLLLGAFEEVVVDDRIGGTRRVIRPAWEKSHTLADGTTREQVAVSRDDEVSTRWLLFRRKLPDLEDLAGAVLAGARLGEEPGRPMVAPADGEPSAPFYLFFPTKIRSGLPFLLHGYFEVNAARTDFYEGATERNEPILDEIAQLVRAAVEDMASTGDAGLASLVDLLGEAQDPEDELARRFRDSTLDLLDEVAWVPLEGDCPDGDFGKPTEILAADDADVVEKLRAAFPAAYVREHTGLGVPARGIGASGNRFVISRQPDDSQSLWETIEELCRPGAGGAWEPGDEEIGFLALLELFAALRVKDGDEAKALLDELRGDDESVLVPVSAGSAGVRMVSLPDPTGGVAGQRSRGVMARTQKGTPAEGDSLVPPASLNLDFVPDGLLETEREIDDAKAFGIRPFTVGNIVDRLVGATEGEDEGGETARFLWRLLTREHASEFSIGVALERTREFDPSDWFWPTAGGPDRERQSRLRSMARVLLPARDDSWQAAESLAFGVDWAAAIESALAPSPARDRRCEAYAALDAVSPRPETLVASPERLLERFGDVTTPVDPESGEPINPVAWLHAFLLRLGVWETLPAEAFDDAGQTNRDRFPWADDPLSDERDESIGREGWIFGEHWSGGEHRNVWVAQDFRFRWSLGVAAAAKPVMTSRLVGFATGLYEDLRYLTVFCPRCNSERGSHTARRSSGSSNGYPSLLAVELRTAGWVPAVRDGSPLNSPGAPSSVWWAPSIPSGAALTQSPLRFLALCDPEAEVGSRLRDLVGIESLEDADSDSVLDLLNSLREQFEDDSLTPDPGQGSGARRAFVALHRLAYERLADLDEDEPAAEDGIDVLCEVGDKLEYRPAGEVFHDDGSFASYRRYFGSLPFAELAKEKLSVAHHLGVQPFEVDLERRPSSEPEDVADEIPELLADRIPEFLAILVHHVLAGQTLDPDSADFRTRARRLQQLRVMTVENLVIEARVKGADASTTIGEHSEEELFLEGEATPHPVIYHDLKGEGWRDAFRRRLAPHIARIIERPDYADVFALFLLDDTDVQREATLLERGITQADVDEIRTAVGIVSEGEKRAYRLWFGTILALIRGEDAPADVVEETIPEALEAAGLSPDEASRLIDRGGGDQARRDVEPDGALAQLRDRGADLRALDEMLKAAGDDGLRIRVARARLREWTVRHGRAGATVLAERLEREHAKAIAGSWRVPASLDYELNPSPGEWLAPVVASLREAGFEPRVEALTDDPAQELMRLAGADRPEEFESRTEALYDEEQQRAILAAAGVLWRRQLKLVGLLVRTAPADGRAAIRRREEEVDTLLPQNPASPIELRESLSELLPGHSSLVDAFISRLTDSVAAPGADRETVLALASEHGVETTHTYAIDRALQAPRRELARRVREGIETMQQNELRVAAPEGLAPPPPKKERERGSRKVAKVKVDGSVDRRKRELGDRAERWALAAMIGELKDLDADSRGQAIDALLEVFERFEGEPAEAARAHAEEARAADLEEDELIDELAGFLHVAGHSDAFGFDMLGWIAHLASDEYEAMLVEVKSSVDGTFHLSPNEWRCAEDFASDYCALVVRRAATSALPQRLDLLVDPVRLVAEEQLSKTPDGYLLGYVATS
ncbi:MAG: DUF3883 domain-containing protein [Thermoleophilaceae bacterium]|nr:DUF3883 domain-containing protein [Thermoleophilaceae bacterium]